MQKIKPVGCHIDFRYECPRCGSELWATEEEAKSPGFRFVCCGQALVLETIKKSTVSLSYKESFAVKKGQANEALKLLGELGFVGSQYEAMAYELATAGESAENIVRKCIAI